MKSVIAYQPDLFDRWQFVIKPVHARYHTRSGAFVDNMSLPVHRWFRYSAGFSADWVRHFVREKKKTNPHLSVLDPFAGVGTTLLACDAEHVKSFGFDTHPFVYRIAKAKLYSIRLKVDTLAKLFNSFLDEASSTQAALTETEPTLLRRCYTEDVLSRLTALKKTFHCKYSTLYSLA